MKTKVSSKKPRKVIRRKLFNLTSPIFVETLLIMLTGTVDVFMLSRYSDETVAAGGVVNQLLNLVFILYGITTLGTSVLCAQYLGAKQKKNVAQVIGVSLLANLLMGLLVSAGLFFLARPSLQLMGLDESLIGYGISYMKIVGGFSFLQALSMTLSAILRSHNKAYYPMFVTLLINIVNVIGNYMLIFGNFGAPRLGITGAGISTSLSRLLAVGLLAYILFSKVTAVPSLKLFKPFPWDKIKNLLTIGLPAAGEQVSYNLSQVLITYFSVMLGTAALTARTYAMSIVMFSYVFAIAIGQGAAISIGHLIGEERDNAAFSVEKYSIKLAMLVTVCISVLTALVGTDIFKLLSSNPEVISIGATVLYIDVLLEIGRAVNITSVNSLNAAGDVMYPFITGIIVMWGVATLLSYVLGIWWGWGLNGIWLAMALDENIRAVVFERRWKSRKWEDKSFTRRRA
ncbi:MATE family efflux transporter [Candidatus Avelusimicrobium gallicola]|uniref:MATE family efflux transporter n=1 Tax=Candidatus Avelusimicrobium gallicola TaxID=2562704 RepID=A0A1Y4DDD4_9BACT|nr:MATE family efflux transporter [Elusimicrobium sp. An273]OUO56885.1 MATE family efflux transporter [Elusimicrobium sp. An273]